VISSGKWVISDTHEIELLSFAAFNINLSPRKSPTTLWRVDVGLSIGI